MGNSSYMPELQHDPSTYRVHLLYGLTPAGDLLVGMDPGRIGIARSLGRDLTALGDNQASRSPLAVIGRHQRSRSVSGTRAVTGHRSHHHPVRQPESTGIKWAKESLGNQKNRRRSGFHLSLLEGSRVQLRARGLGARPLPMY